MAAIAVTDRNNGGTGEESGKRDPKNIPGIRNGNARRMNGVTSISVDEKRATDDDLGRHPRLSIAFLKLFAEPNDL